MAEKKVQPVTEEKETGVVKKKFPVKLIVLFIVGLFLFGGGICVLKGGLLNKFFGKEEEALAAKRGSVQAGLDIGPIFSMDTFIVNLVDPLGKRYLKLRLELELEGEILRTEVDRRLPQLKDTIITLLSSKRFEDVASLEGKLQLRAEMTSLLNQRLRTGIITNIYFTEFIVQ